MAWIESHQEVGRHPKTKKLARLLGVSLPAAIGHLHFLWWWALDFAQDSVLDKFDVEDIADAMHWDGDPNELWDALIASGYVDLTETGSVIHDWAEYAGKLLERRAKDRARKRAAGESAGVPTEFRQSSAGVPTEAAGNLNDSSVTNQPTNLNQPTVPTVPTVPTNQQLIADRFASFWSAYPKKVGKKACVNAWTKLNPNDELFDKIMSSLTWQKKSAQWTKDDGRFIPNPLTWLNQGRWDNEPMEPVSTAMAAAASSATAAGGAMATLRRMFEAEGGVGA